MEENWTKEALEESEIRASESLLFWGAERGLLVFETGSHCLALAGPELVWP